MDIDEPSLDTDEQDFLDKICMAIYVWSSFVCRLNKCQVFLFTTWHACLVFGEGILLGKEEKLEILWNLRVCMRHKGKFCLSVSLFFILVLKIYAKSPVNDTSVFLQQIATSKICFKR